VTADLPTSTKSPELDDANAAAVLKADLHQQTQSQSPHTTATEDNIFQGSAVTLEIMKRYLAYLVAVGFVEKPGGQGKLPEMELAEGQREALGSVGGRGGMV